MVGIPNRDRRAERREATRQEILSAAWEVARLNGIAGLTLREVAVRVGMQPPSLYSHFDSKNAIYDAMFAQAWQQLTDTMTAAAADRPREPRRRLVHFVTKFVDFALADSSRNQLMNVRVVPDFVVQDGDPRGDGEGGPGFTLRDELSERPYLRGTVGMALDWPDTGGSQFFITLSPQPHLDAKYTVIGEVVAGMDVADRLAEGDVIRGVRVWDGKQ